MGKSKSYFFLVGSSIVLFLIQGSSGFETAENGMWMKSKIISGQLPEKWIAQAGIPVNLLRSLAAPPNPTADIPWSGGFSGVADIQTAFNNARSTENTQLGISIPMLTMPTQFMWDTMTNSDRFLKKLRTGEPLLADGATGTALQNQGLETGRIPETWLFERPERIRALHQSYIDAGSDIILTCSFGGTRYRLEGDGLADRVVEVNRRAAELARQVAGDRVFVAGDMGPTGQLLAPLGTMSYEEAADAYAEQASGLAAGGVDFLLIETMSDLDEARAAIEGVRRATHLPVVCTFSFDTHGRTMMGIRPAQVAREIGPLVEGIGANCGRDPGEYPSLLATMVDALRETSLNGTILWAKPNAGLPHVQGDEVIYDASPEYMGQIALELVEAGAQVIGGCCGTTPVHVRAMDRVLRNEPEATPGRL